MRNLKYFWITLFTLIAPFLVLAQEVSTQTYNSLEIDPSSFMPVHTDALTGVQIDKIDPDFSQRPCARLKLHVNRMTRDDIDQISVKVVGGNVVVMKRIVAAEGNGLIIELTAKPETTFYLHHDKYGDSNKVTLNLEGNKEYRLSAQLNQLQTVIVSSNVIGADVYIDNEYKGKTDSSYTLKVEDVTHGTHKLRVEYGGTKSEQDIVVDSINIYFRVVFDTRASIAQYVVFEVDPDYSIVKIDDKEYTPDQGVVSLSLQNGTYRYSVSAKDYHTEQGEFVVNGKKVERRIKLAPAHGWLRVSNSSVLSGAKVYIDEEFVGTAPLTSEKIPSGSHKVKIVKSLYHPHEATVTIEDGTTHNYAPELVPNFATVTLTTAQGAEIWVDGKLVGTTSWRGNLSTGSHRFETRKENHRSTLITKNIDVKPANQSYEIPAPEPISGALDIKSSPALATIYLDGKEIGRTPLKESVIIGQHEVKLSKSGYNTVSKSIKVEEGKSQTLEFTLSKEEVAPTYSSSDSSNEKSEGRSYSIKYGNSTAAVYVDGKYQGLVKDGVWLSHGAHYIVVRNGSYYYGRNFYVGEYSNGVLDMSGAMKVDSPYKKTTSSSTSSYKPKSSIYKPSYSGSSKAKNKEKKDGFNVGLSLGLGWEAGWGELEFNAGLVWRLWRYNSRFNVMTGFTYMRTDESNYLSVPLVVNWNVIRDDFMSAYVGVGTELALNVYNWDGLTYTVMDFPLVAQAGFGLRHFDMRAYCKLYMGLEMFTHGVSFTYFF